jgi:hypothetical protein
MNKPLLAGYMALAQARLWTEAGRPQDAMDLLMDNCVFAHDLAFNGGFVGHAAATILYDLSLDEVRKIVQSGKLNHESLSRLSTNLESLERDFPSLGPVMLNKALFDGNILLQVESENEKDLGIASLKPLIPQVLSRIWYSGAFLTVEATARKLQDIERKPFNKAQAEVESAKADFQGSWNPITRAMSSLPNAIGREDRYRRETLTFIRLLRTATEFISSGQAPSFDDPFGAKLPQSREGGRLRFWSVGPDGKNNDGKGPSTWSVGTFPEGQDIVLEIEARPSHQ